MQPVALCAFDPKDRRTFEGATPPLLKFANRAEVQRWLFHGTGKSAVRKPPVTRKTLGRGPMPPKAQVKAVADRAEALSKQKRDS